MNLWLALRRLLPLLAVLSLALTPVAAPAAAVGMHAATAQGHHAQAMGDSGMAGMDHAAMRHQEAALADGDGTGMNGMGMDDMPCCPASEVAKHDCAKGCPPMALCQAAMTSLPPPPVRVPAPVATRASVTWPQPAAPSSVHGPPLPEPPRA